MITLDRRIDCGAGRKRKQPGRLRRDRPQVGLLLAQPIKKKRATRSPRDFLGVQRRRLSRGALPEESQTLGQGSSATVVGPAQGVVDLSPCHEEVNIVLVNARGVGEERKLGVFMPHRIASRLESSQRRAKFTVCSRGQPLVYIEQG